MGIDYLFANVDKKEYFNPETRKPHTENSMLLLVYLIMYRWNGDRIYCVRDAHPLWDEIRWNYNNEWSFIPQEVLDDFYSELEEKGE